MGYDKWTGWFRFSEVYEFHGLITPNKKYGSRPVTWRGKTGPMHTDNGFRLRSSARASFKNLSPIENIENTPCPLEMSDTGVYWIRINIMKDECHDYIGECAEKTKGIHGRLVDHFSKIVAAEDFRKQFKTTEPFKNLRANLLNRGIEPRDPENNFFNDHVQLAFVKVRCDQKKSVEKIAKIEGMALQAYKAHFGRFPTLNSRDETIGMGGIDELLES